MVDSAAACGPGAHGTEPGGGSRATPIPEGIGEPDDPDPATVSVRHPHMRGRGINHQATLLPSRAVAKVCYSCGKGPAFGHSRSHSMVATKRRFNPNLQKVRIDVGGAPRREYVCTRCLKAGKVLKHA
jgi:large subunit ribosomal protein L28